MYSQGVEYSRHFYLFRRAARDSRSDVFAGVFVCGCYAAVDRSLPLAEWRSPRRGKVHCSNVARAMPRNPISSYNFYSCGARAGPNALAIITHPFGRVRFFSKRTELPSFHSDSPCTSVRAAPLAWVACAGWCGVWCRCVRRARDAPARRLFFS